MEFAATHVWIQLWLESDSTNFVQVFNSSNFIPYRLRNCWHNCLHSVLQTICSHIFREGIVVWISQPIKVKLFMV